MVFCTFLIFLYVQDNPMKEKHNVVVINHNLRRHKHEDLDLELHEIMSSVL